MNASFAEAINNTTPSAWINRPGASRATPSWVPITAPIATAYEDNAEGLMEDIAPGRMAVTKVWLRPVIAWEGVGPTAAELAHLHHEAHLECFIANSVTTEVVVEAAA